MMSSSSAVSPSSMSDSIMSTRSFFNELQGAMAQTQHSRRMIIDALSDSERSDGNSNIDVASSVHAAAVAMKINNDVTSGVHVDVSAVKKKMPELRMQSVLAGVAILPFPVRNSASNATRTTNDDEMTKAEENVKRALEVAREKIILDMRLADMYRGVGR